MSRIQHLTTGLTLLALTAATVVLTAIALAVAAAAAPSADAAKPSFVSRGLHQLRPAKLYDLTATDANGDGNLDLFSANHKFRGMLLLGNEAGAYTDAYYETGISATPEIPGFDNLFLEPEIGAAGLYLWVDREGVTHIRTHRLGQVPQIPDPRVIGEIRFLGREALVRKAFGARVDVTVDRSSRPATGVVGFDMGPNGEILIRAKFMDLPFQVTVEESFPRQRIQLGGNRSSPPENEFVVDLGDRHGNAWADFNRDGLRDVYIANGGNRGAVRRFGELSTDELYLANGDGTFSEGIGEARIDKGFCRGRYAAPVDYDSDGDLDIFVGCEKIHPLLWQQKRAQGRFGSRSSELTEVGVRGDLYRWIDLDQDLSPELISIKDDRAYVYARNGANTGFSRVQKVKAKRLGKTLDVITIADIDSDLDPDVFVGSRGGNAVLLNRGGRLTAVAPAEFGLPNRGSIVASFVDFDNNGLLDFHSAPHGLFKGRRAGQYHRTGSLKVGGRGRWATSTWADLEHDGDRDLISLIKRKGTSLRSRIEENRTAPLGHWIALDLRGPLGNKEAIGARVVIDTVRGRYAGWVGESEGSRFSTGHYTIYRGLGPTSRIRSIRVFWPDGEQSLLEGVAVDQRLTITHP